MWLPGEGGTARIGRTEGWVMAILGYWDGVLSESGNFWVHRALGNLALEFGDSAECFT